jgi:type II secretory pathway pseudopilin PulG
MKKYAMPSRRRAATLIEAIFVMVIMTIISMGTGVALQTLARTPAAANRTLATSNLLIDKMEQLRALGFTALSTASNGSDSPTADGITFARSWTILANPGGKYDANFIQLTVTIGNQNLISAVCKQ